uniref:SMB domain-containing protein n=1 Tax=Magallana gigas TaxID=29159 RepID=A0A8W8KH11_MAGGI
MIIRFWPLARILILISPFKASIGILFEQYPTQNDFDETYSLTSWMTNTTAKNVIQEYLILCPGQDMCLGSMFKRNFSFWDNPACTPCECDDLCVIRSNCCPSKFYRQTDTPSFIEYHTNVSITRKQTPISCFEPLWNLKGLRSKRSYWMIETCSSNINCILPPSKNISSSTPVTSMATNQTYRNVQCALCNQEEIASLVEWEKIKFCNSRSALFAKEDINSLYQSVFSSNPVCNIGFDPPTFYEDKVQPCVAYTIEDKCNESNTNKVVDAYLIKACQEFYLPYTFFKTIYKNIYCALCEHDFILLPIQYYSGGYGQNDDFLPNQFSALIDFQQIQDEPIKKSLECAKNQILDNRLNMCLDIECEVEYRYHNQSCSLVHQMVNKNNYEINLIASITVNDREMHPTNTSSQSILDEFVIFLEQIRKIEQEELCSSKAIEKSTAHQNLGTARVEKESTTNEELLKTLQSIEKRLEKVELMHNQSNELSPPNTQFYGRGRAFRREHSYNRGNNRESVLTEQSENGQQGVIVCPGLLSMKNAGRNKRVNVKVNPLAESCVIGKSMKLKSEEVDETPQKLRNIDWREEQGKDKVISRVKDLLNGGVKPSGNNMQQESELVRLLLREWRQLVVERGILVRKAVIAGEEVRQLVLPESTEKMPRPQQKESTEKSDISESESSDEGTIIRKRKGKTKRNLSISERKSTADSYDSSRQYSTMGSSHSTGRSSITRNSTTTFESPTQEITEPRRSERVRKPPESISRMWYDYFSVDKMI